MYRIPVLRNKVFLYVCLLGFATTILIMTLRPGRIKFLGNVRSDDQSITDQGRQYVRNEYTHEHQEGTYAESKIPVKVNEIRPNAVNSVREAGDQNTLLAGNSLMADKEPQNETQLRFLLKRLDTKHVIEQVGKLIKDLQNVVHSRSLVGNVNPSTVRAERTGTAAIESPSTNKALLAQSTEESIDNRNGNIVRHTSTNQRNDIEATFSANTESPKREHQFLDDFITYPCIQGLAEFPSYMWEKKGRCVRTVNYTESVQKIIPGHQCVNVRTETRGKTMPICVYPAAMDKYVSASSIMGNLWESPLIFKMANYIKLEKQKQPDIEFLDLGSNIGCYSLYMAHEDIPVTAIDPLHSNMELISKSILLGKLEDRIKLIWNAVADNHNTVTFIPDKNNVGGTRITDINPVENVAVMDVARAITFDDLLPLFRGKHIAMKMDIEESEYPALLGGERFFQEVDIKVVQMEFMWHKKGKDGPKILEFFTKRGFQAFSDLQMSMSLHSTPMIKWPNDIYFMKTAHKPSANVAHREHNFLDDFITYPCINGLKEFPSDTWEKDGRCVRTVNLTASINRIIPGHQCVNVRTERRGNTMPICVYPAAMDKYVSASSIMGNLWESPLIFKMANYIKFVKQKQPDIEFLDLGSNIGCYSLYMAHEGIPVTAIDPLHSNMELVSKSILLGKLQDRMKLIWNAVADNHNTVTFIPDKNNVGGTRITDINPVENVAVMDVARAITFDDLLPLFRGKHIAMKMDIEESEYPALLGGERFFQEVDIKVVQMEFMWHKKGKDGPKILEFFTKRGFQAFSDLQMSMSLHSTPMIKWPNDIYFMKTAHKPSANVAHREHNFLYDFITYPCINGLKEFPSDTWEKDGRCVRTVNLTASINRIIPGHQCVNVRTERRGKTMPICVYPAAMDKYVSASSIMGNLWESPLIFKMANYIKFEKQKQPDIEFLDLGSNIGCYSLYMAHEGIPVTAIDPLHSNMELVSKSILLGKLQDRMKLIWNAVADNHNTVTFIPDKNNVGRTRITDINPVENVAVMDVARAITFDDLLPLFRGKHIAMKMDIEESEYPALLGGERFFQEVDVKVVQMEFMWHKKGKDGPKIHEFFTKRGFQPFDDLQMSMSLNSTPMIKWPNDIYFMKPEYNH